MSAAFKTHMSSNQSNLRNADSVQVQKDIGDRSAFHPSPRMYVHAAGRHRISLCNIGLPLPRLLRESERALRQCFFPQRLAFSVCLCVSGSPPGPLNMRTANFASAAVSLPKLFNSAAVVRTCMSFAERYSGNTCGQS